MSRGARGIAPAHLDELSWGAVGPHRGDCAQRRPSPATARTRISRGLFLGGISPRRPGPAFAYAPAGPICMLHAPAPSGRQQNGCPAGPLPRRRHRLVWLGQLWAWACLAGQMDLESGVCRERRQNTLNNTCMKFALCACRAFGIIPAYPFGLCKAVFVDGIALRALHEKQKTYQNDSGILPGFRL